jgi:hypothetical protein
VSAYIVGDDHIDALLTYAIDNKVGYYVNNGWVYIDDRNVTEIGRILMTENERSVAHRYGDNRLDEMTGEETAANYKYRRWRKPLQALEVIKGCNCFDYQACETDDYDQSLAKTIVGAIRERAVYKLPGYDNAGGWEFRRAN